MCLKRRLKMGLIGVLIGTCAASVGVFASEDDGGLVQDGSEDRAYKDEAVMMIGGSCDLTENGYEIPFTVSNSAGYDFEMRIENLEDADGNEVLTEGDAKYTVPGGEILEDVLVLQAQPGVTYGDVIVSLNGEDMGGVHAQFSPNMRGCVTLYLKEQPDNSFVPSIQRDPDCKTCSKKGSDTKVADTATDDASQVPAGDAGAFLNQTAVWIGTGILCAAIFVGGLFLYYKKFRK